MYLRLAAAKSFAIGWNSPQSPRHRHKRVFQGIYQRNRWGGAESKSGTGSSLEQTERVREELPSIIKRLGVSSFLDAPCGDFHWLKEIELPIERYVGVDLVPEIIESNQAQYNANYRVFLVRDITRSKLPRADLIFCRDCLGHLSFEDIQRVLENFKSTRSTYLLTTTFPQVKSNVDIPTGSWRPINLQLPPLSLPPPLELILENCTENSGQHSDKSLGLWRVSDIPSSAGRFLKKIGFRLRHN
jgi:hypothetical protein